jgi:hypothetical protein
MGSTTYRHLPTEELTALRDRLVTALADRLTQPTSIGSNGRQVQYAQSVAELRREIDAVNAELTRRGANPDAMGAAAPVGGPIYLV